MDFDQAAAKVVNSNILGIYAALVIVKSNDFYLAGMGKIRYNEFRYIVK